MSIGSLKTRVTTTTAFFHFKQLQKQIKKTLQCFKIDCIFQSVKLNIFQQRHFIFQILDPEKY